MTSAFPKRSMAEASVPVKRCTDDLVGSKGVVAADWSGAHRPTSAPASVKAMASRDTEKARPPYSGRRLGPARKTLMFASSYHLPISLGIKSFPDWPRNRETWGVLPQTIWQITHPKLNLYKRIVTL